MAAAPYAPAGKEGAAFFDVAELLAAAPPAALVFMHGHGPYDAWHHHPDRAAATARCLPGRPHGAQQRAVKPSGGL